MDHEPLDILLIDDDELDRKSILRQIKSQNLDHSIAIAETGEEGLRQLREIRPGVVLLDYRLANMTGLDILETLNRENLLTMPVIMLSGMDDESLMLKCLEHGAQDFLVKSEVTGKTLLRAIRYAKERKYLQQQLLTLAKYDPLTGLANRELFTDRMKTGIAKAKRHNERFAVLFIDIDHFKVINDSLGHSTGDELLKSIGLRLQNSMREEDVVARLGGDEFGVLIDDIENIDSVARIATNLISNLKPPHQCNQNELVVSPSIGISIYPECGTDIGSLVQAADTAMYEVKRNGRNSFQFFSSIMQQQVAYQLKLENALRQAVECEEFNLHYQPQFNAITQRVVATEALLRWNNPEIGQVTPDQFIPVAEDTGLIKEIGMWVLSNACQQNIKWSTREEIRSPLSISINVSIVQLKSDEFLDYLTRLLSETQIVPRHLVLEITESIMSDDPDDMIHMLTRIHDLGVLIAIDDFGTGYSSLSYLRNLPIDILKIDQTFVSDIGVSVEGEAIVKTIISLAHNLGLQVIAEGVENKGQVDFLVEHHCDILQGYFFSRPVGAEELTRHICKERWIVDTFPNEKTKRSIQ